MPPEEAQQRRLLVVFAEAFDEVGVREDASPAGADEGCTWEGRRLRREAEEDLLEEILIVQRGHRQRTSIVIVQDLG
jgi:hypothetical protein